jgi:hypothetical protein
VRDRFTLRPHAVSVALAGQAPCLTRLRFSKRALRDNLQAASHSVEGLSHIATAAQYSIARLRSGSKPRVKSLFRNILPISPYGSRFCQNQPVYLSHKSLEINILENRAEKIAEICPLPKIELNDKAQSSGLKAQSLEPRAKS